MARLRRGPQTLHHVCPRWKLQLPVEPLLAVERQAIAPDPRGGDRVRAGVGGPDYRVHLDALNWRGAREGVQPLERAAQTMLPPQDGAVAGQKAHFNPAAAIGSLDPRSARHRDAAADPCANA